ncbi:hypothetical protein SERLA73DRAFT_184405 [Serpula lacrymans var. lacrymans S7.3]|uniref:Uncharacterized protein n=2 Tax=Serpula lacrymans var. lacrymans TaxID=341189 RepID=F8Q360_SERL3|nr:uncharacterized protein SERLADRAFT_472081 [Serpula lacrymans var. lacrymans S7.9]EGN97621.1 hypothetical protein SERLA73DRAFT_184405 [Serpula lacrymans var. lacrymans S7.3]EGO23212.1 hypothetical protein SERLADRAFT_472081 [Serpula lacrymans var. lacrymans S7.9]
MVHIPVCLSCCSAARRSSLYPRNRASALPSSIFPQDCKTKLPAGNKIEDEWNQ